MRRTSGWLLAGLLSGVVACGGDDNSSPEQVLRVESVSGPIVELDGAVWMLAGEAAIEFDGATSERLRQIELNSTYTGSFEREGEVLWATGIYGLKRLDPATGTVTTADRSYESLAMPGRRLFGISDGDLHEIDPQTGADLGQVTLPLNEFGSDFEVVPMPLVAVGDMVWVTVAESNFSFTAFDPATGTFGAQVEVDEGFGAAVLVGDVIWLADRYGKYVVVDATTGERVDVTAELPVGETILDSNGSLFVGADDSLWLLDQPAQNVYQLDPHTGETLGSFHLRWRPSSMAVTATDLWITNGYDDRITVLPRSAVKG